MKICALAIFSLVDAPGLFANEMVRHRGVIFRLRPSADQEQVFREHTGVCRLVWNLALEQRRNHWRQFRRGTSKSPNFNAQASDLTSLRTEVGFVKAVLLAAV